MKTRNIFSLLLVLLLCCVTLMAAAASKDAWQKARGSYVWTESSQYNNGLLNILPLEGDIYLYEFKVLRGSEAEASAEEFQTAGTFFVDDKGEGVAELPLGNDAVVTLLFALQDKSITVEQQGELPLDVGGEYKYNELAFDASENAAVALIESLPGNLTSLTAANRPYKLLYADETVDGWFYQLTAVFEPTNEVIAKYLVAADLSAVYRNDDGAEPGLIYGSPENMLAAKRSPLVEVEELEAPAVENAELEGNSEEDEQAVSNESQVSPLVAIAPEQESLRVGESTEISAQLPGKLGYTVADLVSKNSDVVKLEGNTLVAVAPGTATVQGNLQLEKGKQPFSVTVTVYEPRLEADNLPAHLAIGGSLPLQAFIPGEEGYADAEWSVSDDKIATIEEGKLVGKADGLVTVTAKHGDMSGSWYVAVGKAELPLGALDEPEEDAVSWLTLLGAAALAGGAGWWFFKRKK